MTNPTPRQIKVQVLYQWIQGIPRDKIAENDDSGRGTVTNIIEQFKRRTIPDIDLMRETSNKKRRYRNIFICCVYKIKKIVRRFRDNRRPDRKST